ncbi:hypothetical protein [Burkholderia anthina]|nr:hypothetical protein [Burkholderia anthina]
MAGKLILHTSEDGAASVCLDVRALEQIERQLVSSEKEKQEWILWPTF